MVDGSREGREDDTDVSVEGGLDESKEGGGVGIADDEVEPMIVGTSVGVVKGRFVAVGLLVGFNDVAAVLTIEGWREDSTVGTPDGN